MYFYVYDMIGEMFSGSSFSLLVSILLIVEYWLLFQKAGEKGWASLIPFYNKYVSYKIAKKEKLFWWYLGVKIATFILGTTFVGVIVYNAINCFYCGRCVMPYGFGYGYGSYTRPSGCGYSLALLITMFIIGLLLLAGSVALIALEAKRSIELAQTFGQPKAFGIGLLLLEPIFVGILAFGNNYQYIHKTEETKVEAEDIKVEEYTVDAENISSVAETEEGLNNDEYHTNEDDIERVDNLNDDTSGDMDS